MKFYKVFSIITLMIFITHNKSLGKSVRNSEKSWENKDFLKTLQNCHELNDSITNLPGNVNNIMQHICVSSKSTKTAIKSKLPFFIYRIYSSISKNFKTLNPLTTSGGLNCRKHMNSELNDLGEIIDTVAEICDLPTTTTTTTRRPTTKTTPKMLTTTAKPLVKVCRPVMNSYISEQGEIIDTVNIFCKMEVMN